MSYFVNPAAKHKIKLVAHLAAKVIIRLAWLGTHMELALTTAWLVTTSWAGTISIIPSSYFVGFIADKSNPEKISKHIVPRNQLFAYDNLT